MTCKTVKKKKKKDSIKFSSYYNKKMGILKEYQG